MDIVMAIVGGSCGAAIVAGIFGLITWRLNRKAHKEDKAAEQTATDCAAREKDLKELRRMIEVLFLADRTILHDRIKHLGKSYIARGYVTVEELEDLTLMHGVYHDKDKLNGNGFLDELMTAVNQLEKRVSKI